MRVCRTVQHELGARRGSPKSQRLTATQRECTSGNDHRATQISLCALIKQEDQVYAMALLDRPQRFGAYSAVRTLEDLQFLIKVHEAGTGQRGRVFVVTVDGKRLTYRVTFDGAAYRVEGGLPAVSSWMLEEELMRSCFGEALKAGQVFAPEWEQG